MPLLETLPVGPDTAQWPLWSTTARVVVTDPAALPRARQLVADITGRVERACSRFRADSELALLPDDGLPAGVSPLLAELIAVGLRAARRTEGDVDPTLGAALVAAGYDRTFALVVDTGTAQLRGPFQPRAWTRVRLDGAQVTVPVGVRLDLGATAKAWTADTCAHAVVACCGGGVLVALGGDVATAGEAPAGGWRVLVRDLPDDPACQVVLDAGGALATSSTVSRSWRRGGARHHHVLDPATGASAVTPWRTVSVAAGTCEEANTVSTAAVVRGLDALPWLRGLDVPVRLVSHSGKITTFGGWPQEQAR